MHPSRSGPTPAETAGEHEKAAFAVKQDQIAPMRNFKAHASGSVEIGQLSIKRNFKAHASGSVGIGHLSKKRNFKERQRRPTQDDASGPGTPGSRPSQKKPYSPAWNLVLLALITRGKLVVAHAL